METSKFASAYRVDESSGCWLWQKALDSHGYGQVSVPGIRSTIASRVSYEIHIAPIPKGLCVLHSCDTPACVNPGHLFLGTHAENMRDRDRKKRRKAPSGADHWRSRRRVQSEVQSGN